MCADAMRSAWRRGLERLGVPPEKALTAILAKTGRLYELVYDGFRDDRTPWEGWADSHEEATRAMIGEVLR